MFFVSMKKNYNPFVLELQIYMYTTILKWCCAVVYGTKSGFVRHLENLEILEFRDFLFQAWNSLKNGVFFESDLEKTLNLSLQPT